MMIEDDGPSTSSAANSTRQRPKEVAVVDLVQLVVNDPLLVERYSLFAEILGTPEAERQQLTRRIRNSTISHEDFDTMILKNWAGNTDPPPTVGNLQEILRKYLFRSAAETIGKLGPSTRIICPKLTAKSNENQLTDEIKSFGVFAPIPTFVGRQDELDKLRDYFLQKKKCVVTYAFGGQGKTELCRKFVELLQEENSLLIVSWFKGDTASDLFTSISDLAAELRIDAKHKSGNSVNLNALIKKIEVELKSRMTKLNWMVVIDNVDQEYVEFVEVVIQFLNLKAFVLITTRRSDVLSGETELLELQALSDADSSLLVNNALKIQDQDQVKLLCVTLGNHALVLQQAVSYIRMKRSCSIKGAGYDIPDYIPEFKKDEEELFKNKLKLAPYDETIYIVVNKTMKHIRESGPEGEIAQQIMNVLCLVRPDGIQNEFLNKLVGLFVRGRLQTSVKLATISDHLEPLKDFDAVIELKDFEMSLLRLREFSMVDLYLGSASTHRMVQKISRIDSKYAAGYIILPRVDIKKTTISELRHITCIWENMTTKEDGSIFVKFKPRFPSQIFKQMGILGIIPEQVGFSEYNYQLLLQIFGKMHPLSEEMECNVACAYEANGKYTEAIAKYEAMLTTVRDEGLRTQVKFKLQVAQLLLRVAKATITELNFYDKHVEDALSPLLWPDFFEKIIDDIIKRAGSDPAISEVLVAIPDIMQRGKFLPQVYAMLVGLIHDSENMESSVEKMIVSEKCDQKPNKSESGYVGPNFLLKSIWNLFVNLKSLEGDQFDKDITILKQEYESNANTLGENHQVTLGTKSCYSHLLWHAGKQDEAIQTKSQVVAAKKETFGATHINTILEIQILSTWKSQVKNEDVKQ